MRAVVCTAYGPPDVLQLGGKRTAQRRALGWAAWSAREVSHPAAAAARAASLAAAIAYTHPLATPHQTNHTLGPAAHGALALELAAGGDPNVGDAEVRRALGHASPQVRDVVCRMARPGVGRGGLVPYFASWMPAFGGNRRRETPGMRLQRTRQALAYPSSRAARS